MDGDPKVRTALTAWVRKGRRGAESAEASTSVGSIAGLVPEQELKVGEGSCRGEIWIEWAANGADDSSVAEGN